MYDEIDRPGPPPRRTGVAGFFTRSVSGELNVLLSSQSGRHMWQLPGGNAQDDEFLHEAYVREITAKAGLPAASPEEILVVDHVPRGVTEAEGLDIVFKGGEIPPNSALNAPHDTEDGPVTYKWATLHETNALCPADERDRIRSAHEAWTTGRTAYLVCGERYSARPVVLPPWDE
ncbi:NUDIX domain-containing protein [Streptomyces sp. NPDC093109]|uniref:NUDIX domain-containing protein n=1 Tax=Streptomyces sp. NPDC093109 TaxID=3154977 RepID=UPI00344F6925